MKVKTFIICLILLGLFLPYFSKDMAQRTVYEKLGFVPQGKLYAALLGEFRWFEGEYYTFKSIIYYGGKAKDIIYNKGKGVEYYNLYRIIKAAVILNPYNEDAYYFAQAFLTWDVRQVKVANSLLEYVYKYRPWDFQIPFFLGFNYAYFLHDYKKAAFYYKKAADLTHSSLFTNLAARYFYKGGETELGISYLRYMINNTKNKAIKKIYMKRLKALLAIHKIELAVKNYYKKYEKFPTNIEDLLKKGFLDKIPNDPYGGKFYLENGKVKTTSKLAERRVKKWKQ